VDFLDRLIDLALEEDLGAAGDITTRALVPLASRGTAELWAKERLVLAGLGAFTRTFQRVDASCATELLFHDGAEVKKGTVVARVAGPLHALLAGERTALNIAQRCSGIATVAREACRAVKGSKLRILDTRKTSPGMRGLSKDAVRAGGAANHRFGLFDGVLIKDNHLAAVNGSIPEALRRAREGAPLLVKIEVEVTTLSQLEEAIAHGAQIVLLDNMTDAQIAKAVKMAAGRVELEASGGVTLERLRKLAKLGVDYVSMGALTHSARAVDLSLEVRSEEVAG
jgi:nicotinate-nucleotide pyrophosphorylase (carboxylating)